MSDLAHGSKLIFNQQDSQLTSNWMEQLKAHAESSCGAPSADLSGSAQISVPFALTRHLADSPFGLSPAY